MQQPVKQEKSIRLKSLTDDLLATAIIRGTFGLEGYLKAESLSGDLQHFANLKRAYVQFYDTPMLQRVLSDGFLEITDVVIRANDVLLRFEGVTTVAAAKQFKSAVIMLPRNEAAPLYDGEFYVNDLCNCVLVCEGCEIGKITGVIEGGSVPLLELTEADTGRIVYIPFNSEFIGEVNLQEFTVELMHRWILD